MKDSFNANYVLAKLKKSISESKHAADSYANTLNSMYRLIQRNGDLYKDKPSKANLKLSSSILSLQMINEIQNRKAALLIFLNDNINLRRYKA